MTGCAPKNQNYFSETDCIYVNRLSADSNINNSDSYYYIDHTNQVYECTLESGERTLLLENNDLRNYYCANDRYIFYTYYDSNAKHCRMNRYDRLADKDELVFENDDTCVRSMIIDIYGDYLYFATDNYGVEGAGAHIYRVKSDSSDITPEKVDITELFLLSNVDLSATQFFVDDLVIDGYYDKEQDIFYVLSLREKDTNRYVLRHEYEEVYADGKRIEFKQESASPNLPSVYIMNGKEYKLECFRNRYYDRSKLYEDYMVCEDENTVIGLISVSSSPQISRDMDQEYVKKDQLFSLNLETGESGILYDTENNGTRIIGYRDGTIYLFDSTYTVYEQRLDSGEQQELGTVPKADEIVFDWQDEYLIIRFKNHAGSDTYEVKVIKIEN